MINKLFKRKYFLLSLQFITLFVFVLLIYGSIGITTNDSSFAKILRNTNFSNLLVWSYWWPLIIASAILFGRYWCSICPMELVTSFFGKIGLRNKPGKLLKSGWVITTFYAIILILGIHTLAIHRIPHFMAIYMLLLFTIAVVVGLIWEKRTFCTYVCPIGHLLGLYSLLSFSKLRVKDDKVCKTCENKECIQKKSHYKLVGRSCTSELYPPKLSDNKDCILCGQCFKSCSKDNIAIQKQKFGDVFSTISLKWAEIVFFIIVSGFVVYEILSEWLVTKKIIMIIPNWVNRYFDVSGSGAGTIKALLLFVLLPLAFYFIFVLAKKLLAGESYRGAFTQLVLAILPITASMHLLKALFKTTSRIPYWDYVFSDPVGVTTAEKILDGSLTLHNDALNDIISPTISIVTIPIAILGLVLSLYIITKQTHKNNMSKAITIIAVLAYSSVFIVTFISWKL